MVKQRSIDEFPNHGSLPDEFPTFSKWVGYVLISFAITVLCSLVICPLRLKLAVWIQPALDEQLNDVLARYIARWKRKIDPIIVRFSSYVAVFLVVAYPIFLLLDRFCRWVSGLGHTPNKAETKKKRIT